MEIQFKKLKTGARILAGKIGTGNISWLKASNGDMISEYILFNAPINIHVDANFRAYFNDFEESSLYRYLNAHGGRPEYDNFNYPERGFLDSFNEYELEMIGEVTLPSKQELCELPVFRKIKRSAQCVDIYGVRHCLSYFTRDHGKNDGCYAVVTGNGRLGVAYATWKCGIRPLCRIEQDALLVPSEGGFVFSTGNPDKFRIEGSELMKFLGIPGSL